MNQADLINMHSAICPDDTQKFGQTPGRSCISKQHHLTCPLDFPPLYGKAHSLIFDYFSDRTPNDGEKGRLWERGARTSASVRSFIKCSFGAVVHGRLRGKVWIERYPGQKTDKK